MNLDMIKRLLGYAEGFKALGGKSDTLDADITHLVYLTTPHHEFVGKRVKITRSLYEATVKVAKGTVGVVVDFVEARTATPFTVRFDLPLVDVKGTRWTLEDDSTTIDIFFSLDEIEVING